jgi:ABC-type Fe3+/spermidine/putrescine transport system ATPase subunit
MIAGLEIPSEGEIIISGEQVTKLPPRARHIAMVFQSYALYPHMTVYRNIAFPLKAQGAFTKGEIDEKVRHAAGVLGIELLLDRKPRQLSGGERQRVALARAARFCTRRITALSAAIRDHYDFRHARPGRGYGVGGSHRGHARGQGQTGRNPG